MLHIIVAGEGTLIDNSDGTDCTKGRRHYMAGLIVAVGRVIDICYH